MRVPAGLLFVVPGRHQVLFWADTGQEGAHPALIA